MNTKSLKDILYGVGIVSVSGATDVAINHLTLDSREAKEGSAFFAIKGEKFDGNAFIDDVLQSGCYAVITEEKHQAVDGVTFVQVKDVHKALGSIANNFFDNPSSQLKVIGITGTNGKTTTTTLLYKLFRKLNDKVGLISTVVNRVNDKEVPTSRTTPHAIAVHELLAQMVEEGCEYCFMEVSSHAIHQHRIGGVTFAGGVFTNITHEHLDYHKTFKEYIDVKKAFFDNLPSDAFALTNVDDKNGAIMLQNTKATKNTYALHSMADFKVKVLENQFSGLVLSINGIELWSRLIGDFNAYNLLAVYGVAMLLEEEEQDVLTALSTLEAVAGRFQYIVSPKEKVTAIVDYAHTPDALENVLKTIQNIRTKNETVFTLVGCGGDRDATKRPEMARIACQYSDKVILTSDNPRTEDPNKIIEDMMKGVGGEYFKKTLSVANRGEAIKTAVSMAESGDIILIAGKGHETYQEINNVKTDFDDMQITVELFEKMEK